MDAEQILINYSLFIIPNSYTSIMRILLLGDYSNVHHTLGEGLRK